MASRVRPRRPDSSLIFGSPDISSDLVAVRSSMRLG